MKPSLHGSARSVTGSRHLVELPDCNVLMNCGMFQGRRQESEHHNIRLGFEPKSVLAVLLSHVHIDHEVKRVLSLAAAIQSEHAGIEIVVPQQGSVHEL